MTTAVESDIPIQFRTEVAVKDWKRLFEKGTRFVVSTLQRTHDREIQSTSNDLRMCCSQFNYH